jgi:ABC-type Fe3+/spermidine/putrescine transport system ATPase subunit
MNDLKVERLFKEYEGKPLLRGIDFQVKKGETLCLLGKSGSGKSTILRIIAGIEKADKGNIFWNGEKIDEIPVHKRNFSLMFQDYALFPHLNVAENVAFGLRMRDMPAADVEKRVEESLAQVNMAGFNRRMVTDLSGGEQQRIALARALAPRPGLLMLDEPLAALDHTLRVELQEELRYLLKNFDIPVIYVTHDQEEAVVLGDRLALLQDGVIVQSGPTEQIYLHPANRWVAEFLGMGNFLDAEVLTLDPFTVKTVCGTFHPENTQSIQLTIGQTGTLLLKPTGVSFEEKLNAPNSLTGTVTACSFRGEHFRLTVQICNGKTFEFFSTRRHETGEVLKICFTSSSVVFLG